MTTRQACLLNDVLLAIKSESIPLHAIITTLICDFTPIQSTYSGGVDQEFVSALVCSFFIRS